jgi:hypothetical protein
MFHSKTSSIIRSFSRRLGSIVEETTLAHTVHENHRKLLLSTAASTSAAKASTSNALPRVVVLGTGWGGFNLVRFPMEPKYILYKQTRLIDVSKFILPFFLSQGIKYK